MPVLPGMPVTTLRRSPGSNARIDPRDLARIRRDGRVDEQPLERMVEIPVIDEMLVVPDDLAGLGVERERRVVIQVLLVRAAENELRGRDRHGRADVDAGQRRIEARHHPRADVPALLHRHVAPALVAGLAGLRDRVRAPQLLAGRGVVRGDHAAFVRRIGLALPARDDLAARDDRARRRARAHVGSCTCVSHTSVPVRASIA